MAGLKLPVRPWDFCLGLFLCRAPVLNSLIFARKEAFSIGRGYARRVLVSRGSNFFSWGLFYQVSLREEWGMKNSLLTLAPAGNCPSLSPSDGGGGVMVKKSLVVRIFIEIFISFHLHDG